jgi:hypothetical protein
MAVKVKQHKGKCRLNHGLPLDRGATGECGGFLPEVGLYLTHALIEVQ